LEDLSAILPDTSYLTRLSIDGDRADISGIAANPTELVPVLEKSGQFSDVAFSDAITKSESGIGNRFSLEMRVGSRGRTP
jgi:Tfp pilus assembly protein PilN